MSTTHPPPGPSGIGDAFGSLLTEAHESVLQLVDAPIWSRDDAGLTDAFATAAALRASADEVMGRLAADMDDRDIATSQGASSTRAHLMAAYRMSAADASRTLRTTRE